MATSVIMNSTTPNNKKLQRSITYVDPSATDAEIVAFAEGMNGLTTNTLSEVRRVDTVDLLNDTRLSHNMSTETQTFSLSSISTNVGNPTQIDITAVGIESNDQVVVKMLSTNEPGTSGFLYAIWLFESYGGTLALVKENSSEWVGTIEIIVPATNNYKADSLVITITE